MEDLYEHAQISVYSSKKYAFLSTTSMKCKVEQDGENQRHDKRNIIARVNFAKQKRENIIIDSCCVFERMDNEKSVPLPVEDTLKEDELFNADELRRLCSKARSFVSEWSSPYDELQTAYQRACLLGRT